MRRYKPTIRRVVHVRLVDRRLQRLFDSMDVCQSVFGSFFVHAALGDYELSTPEQLLNLLVTMSRQGDRPVAAAGGTARLPPRQ